MCLGDTVRNSEIVRKPECPGHADDRRFRRLVE
jgi:hypothetical protein